MSAPAPATVKVLPLTLALPAAPTLPMSALLQPDGRDCAAAATGTRSATRNADARIFMSRRLSARTRPRRSHDSGAFCGRARAAATESQLSRRRKLHDRVPPAGPDLLCHGAVSRCAHD